MKTEPIRPAKLELNAEGLPWSSAYGDVYHPRAGAFVQAEHVFLRGNGLPGRWDDWIAQRADSPGLSPVPVLGAYLDRPEHGLKRTFVILETGFGLGNNFLATWAAWRAWRSSLPLPRQQAVELQFVSIEIQPFTTADMARAHANSPAPQLAAALIGAWPPLTPNLHTLSFDADGVKLMLALGPAQMWLRELVAPVNAFFLDGFSPARNPQMWEPWVFKALARLAAPSATLATWSAARAVRDGLTSAGFEVSRAAGTGGKRDITLARYAPRFASAGHSRLWGDWPAARPQPQPQPQPQAQPQAQAQHQHEADRSADAPEADVIVVGGGLAGCASAWALAQRRLRCVVLDAAPHPAAGASGNPAGLFHGVVHGQDAPHARLYRAAALQAQALARRAIENWGVPGAVDGLVRLSPGESLQALEQVGLDSGLPAAYAHAAGPAELAAHSGWPTTDPGWWLPGGGWLNPAALCAGLLEAAKPWAQWLGGARVERICHLGGQWLALDSHGRPLATAPKLILANAGAAQALLHGYWQTAFETAGVHPGPLMADLMTPTLGQLTFGSPQACGVPPPNVPIAGQGYVIGARTAGGEDLLVFGASSEPGQHAIELCPAAQQANWVRLMRLRSGHTQGAEGLMGIAPAGLTSRAGVRWSTADKLPLVGPVPDWLTVSARGNIDASTSMRSRAGWEQVRHVPRAPGLYLHTGLGSRGITWCALTAQLLAARITNTTWPLEASLVDAIDPARAVSRAVRQGLI